MTTTAHPLRHRSSLAAARALAGIALCAAVAAPAGAGQVTGWWGGNWTCSIDGRPARMKWFPVDDSESSCDGDTCSTTSGARWQGRFSDNGARWVDLNDPRPGNRGGLYFRHADGNRWYLPKPSANKSNGWTTWNGRRYPLSCWR